MGPRDKMHGDETKITTDSQSVSRKAKKKKKTKKQKLQKKNANKNILKRRERNEQGVSSR